MYMYSERNVVCVDGESERERERLNKCVYFALKVLIVWLEKKIKYIFDFCIEGVSELKSLQVIVFSIYQY